MSSNKDDFLENIGSRSDRFDRDYPHFVEMKGVFRRVAGAIVSGDISIFPEQRGKGLDRRVGVEIEYSCIQEDGKSLLETTRNSLVEANKDVLQKELGAAQIEITTPAINISGTRGFQELFQSISDVEQFAIDQLHTLGARPVRLGIDPVVHLDERCRTQTVQRYRDVPDFHTKNRRQGLFRFLVVGNQMIPVYSGIVVGAMSSVQANVDCHSITEAIEMLNIALCIGPFVVAMGANARFINGVDSGMADMRGALWEWSHDIRTYAEMCTGKSSRVGLPEEYFTDLQSYFKDVYDQPPICKDPEKAFETFIGLYWRDSRLKFLRRGEETAQTVLEFRPLSLQPSIEENYALLLFFIGLMFQWKSEQIPLMPLSYVHDNRWSAMMDGIRGVFWSWSGSGLVQASGREVLERMLIMAFNGLLGLGGNESDLAWVREIWEDRLINGHPSDIIFDEVLNLLRQKRSSSGLERELFCEYLTMKVR